MIKKLLIANRGEIACRIIRTAKKMGIKTIAVYSESDRDAPHTQLADYCSYLGPSPATDSYLNIESLLNVAKQNQVDAVHPGYGFLAENADFAKACEEAGLVFVGPKSETIAALGSKSVAKNLMQESGLPVLPGYHGDDNSLATLQTQAESIAYPILIKASAGGGGKGMRIIDHPDQLEEAIKASKREAEKSFGDDKILLEKYLPEPRHIEIQVCLDHQGNGVHLFSRDCSIQRRYQKIIEEAPAPGISDKMESTMGSLAVKAASDLNYLGVGTFEFLVDGGENFYFMEMNTRLQVEHGVTEMITGLDLVEWQLRIASGESIPKKQKDISKQGHAIEARLYAEDPDTSIADQRFIPSTGPILTLSLPKENSFTRLDNGIQAGSWINPYYDPMLAKVICHGSNRTEAIERLGTALEDLKITGIKTNRNFLHRIIQSSYFAQQEISTHFLEQHAFAPYQPSEEEILQYCFLAAFFKIYREKQAIQVESNPWLKTEGWRLHQTSEHVISMQDLDGKELVSIKARSQRIDKQADKTIMSASFSTLSPDKNFEVDIKGFLEIHNSFCATLHADLMGKKRNVVCHFNGQYLSFFLKNHSFDLEFNPEKVFLSEKEETFQPDLAPMNGQITKVHCEAGQILKEGQAIVSMEAMKMEYTLRAPSDGILDCLLVSEDDQVNEGEQLFRFSSTKET